MRSSVIGLIGVLMGACSADGTKYESGVYDSDPGELSLNDTDEVDSGAQVDQVGCGVAISVIGQNWGDKFFNLMLDPMDGIDLVQVESQDPAFTGMLDDGGTHRMAYIHDQYVWDHGFLSLSADVTFSVIVIDKQSRTGTIVCAKFDYVVRVDGALERTDQRP